MNVDMVVGRKSRMPRRKIDEVMVFVRLSHDRARINLSGFKDRAYPDMTKKRQTMGGPEYNKRRMGSWNMLLFVPGLPWP